VSFFAGRAGIPAEVKEVTADCTRIGEVAEALKKMKRHKAPGLSGLTAEMIQATEVLELSGYYGRPME